MSTSPEVLNDLIGDLIYARSGWGGLGQASQGGRAARVAADIRDGGRAGEIALVQGDGAAERERGQGADAQPAQAAG